MAPPALPLSGSSRVGQDDGPQGEEAEPKTDYHGSRPGSSGETPMCADSQIDRLYLTFLTRLPCANTTSRSTSEAVCAQTCPPPAPPPPDLAPFVDPHLWPEHRKNVLLALSCVATFLTAYTAGSYSPPSPLMAAAFGTSQLAVLAGITTFCAGFAFAPMVLAPFSEASGRYPVFIASGAVYVVSQTVCGAARGLSGMLVARLLVGVGGSVFSTMVGGVIADMWDAEARNTPMALFSGSVLAGTGAGPLVCAVLAGRLGGSEHGDAWRWVFWHQVIMGGVLMIALGILFKESRGSVLLSRKATALNRWYEELERAGCYGVWIDGDEPATGDDSDSEITLSDTGARPSPTPDEEKAAVELIGSQSQRLAVACARRLRRIRWVVQEDEERSSLARMISTSLCRPFHLLCTEPVVFFFSMWVAFAWAVLYLTFSSVFVVFSRVYGWDVERCGRVFTAMVAGSALATAVGVCQDTFLLRLPAWQPGSACPSRFWVLMRRRFPVRSPEARLYFACLTSTLLPAGLFMWGFTSRPDVHWIAPAIAVGLATVGIYSVYLATFNYLADVYHKYASSALAAQSFCRNILGGVFPLVTGLMHTNLGPTRAAWVLGSIATALTLVPWVLVFFGERIRARSKFAVALAKSE